MFNIQPHVPGTKPLAVRAEECPKKDEVKDNEGGNTSSAPPTSATVPSVGAGDEIQVEAETEQSIKIAAKAQTDSMDVSHHEDRCFACKDGGGEFFCLVFCVDVALTLNCLHHTF